VTSTDAKIALKLPSEPSALTLVRGMLSGIGEALGLDPELVDDLKTATSEACNNVVLHAYPQGAGPLLACVEVGSDELEITVVDHGVGIRPVAGDDDRMGLGLAVISALADRAQIESEPGEGTAVQMSFHLRGRADGGDGGPPVREVASRERRGPLGFPLTLSGEVRAAVSPTALLGPVLGRMVRALAATAHFSLDRFSDLYLITDELAAHVALAAAADELEFAVSASRGRLELELGLLRAGTTRRLHGPAAQGSFPLARLLDDFRVRVDGDGEILHALVADRGADG
jgi:serine/threonine-protein kinase RsbW